MTNNWHEPKILKNCDFSSVTSKKITIFTILSNAFEHTSPRINICSNETNTNSKAMNKQACKKMAHRVENKTILKYFQKPISCCFSR